MSVGSAVYQSTVPGFGLQVAKDAVAEPLYPFMDHNPAKPGTAERRGQQVGDGVAIAGGLAAGGILAHKSYVNFKTDGIGAVNGTVDYSDRHAGQGARTLQDAAHDLSVGTRSYFNGSSKWGLGAAALAGGVIAAAGVVDLLRSHHGSGSGGTVTPPASGGGGDTPTPPTDGSGDTPPTTTPPDTGGSTPPDGSGTTPPSGGSGDLPPTTPPDTDGSTPPDGSGTTPPTGGSGDTPPTTPPDTDGSTPPDGSGTTPPTGGSGNLPPTTPPDTDGSTPPTPGTGDCGPSGSIPTPPTTGGSTPPTPGKGGVTQMPPTPGKGGVMQMPPPPPVTGSGTGGTPSKAGNIYTVQQGDYLTHVAQSTDRTWQQIYTANQGQISNPDLIYPGERLVIPGKDAPNPQVTYQHLYPGGVVNPHLHDEVLTTS